MQKDLESSLLGILFFTVFIFACLIVGMMSYKCYHCTRLCWLRRYRKHNIEDLETIVINEHGIYYEDMDERCSQQSL
jgi:hypothetical protein